MSPPDPSRIYFPWERRGGLARLLGRGRVRPLLVGVLVLGFLVFVVVRERRLAGLRQTRATLQAAGRALDRYFADHDGGCPPSLEVALGPGQAATDAWGRPLRLTCPARVEGRRYRLESDGPDGLPGGLDRIE